MNNSGIKRRTLLAQVAVQSVILLRSEQDGAAVGDPLGLPVVVVTHVCVSVAALLQWSEW